MPVSLLSTLAVWALVTIALLAVAIYRGVLAKDETDRIFVSQSENRLAVQQQQIIEKVSRLDQFVKGLAWTSGGLLVISVAIWIWTSFANL